jgi:hypothetical protein
MRKMFGGVFILILLGIGSARAQNPACGKVPEWDVKSRETDKTKGDLEGKAQALFKSVGSAELTGNIQSERQIIYKTTDQSEARRQDAYLAYMFCVLIMNDKNISTDDKLKAINAFRRPIGSSELPQNLLNQISSGRTFDYLKSLVGVPYFERPGLARFRKSGYEITVKYSQSEGADYHTPRNALETILLSAEEPSDVLVFDGWWNTIYTCVVSPCPRTISPSAKLGRSTVAEFVGDRTGCYVTSLRLTKNEHPLFRYKCSLVSLFVDGVSEFLSEEDEATTGIDPRNWLDLARHYFDQEDVWFDQSGVELAEKTLNLNGKSATAKRDTVQSKLFSAISQMKVGWFQLQFTQKAELDWYDLR